MKYHLLVISGLLLTLFYSYLSPSTAHADNTRQFQVVSTQGQVYIVNEDDVEQLATGSEIKAGDSIKVSPKSSVLLMMDNNKENMVHSYLSW